VPEAANYLAWINGRSNTGLSDAGCLDVRLWQILLQKSVEVCVEQ